MEWEKEVAREVRVGDDVRVQADGEGDSAGQRGEAEDQEREAMVRGNITHYLLKAVANIQSLCCRLFGKMGPVAGAGDPRVEEKRGCYGERGGNKQVRLRAAEAEWGMVCGEGSWGRDE